MEKKNPTRKGSLRHSEQEPEKIPAAHKRGQRELLGHKGVFTLMSQHLCQGIGLDFSW